MTVSLTLDHHPAGRPGAHRERGRHGDRRVALTGGVLGGKQGRVQQGTLFVEGSPHLLDVERRDARIGGHLDPVGAAPGRRHLGADPGYRALECDARGGEDVEECVAWNDIPPVGVHRALVVDGHRLQIRHRRRARPHILDAAGRGTRSGVIEGRRRPSLEEQDLAGGRPDGRSPGVTGGAVDHSRPLIHLTRGGVADVEAVGGHQTPAGEGDQVGQVGTRRDRLRLEGRGVPGERHLVDAEQVGLGGDVLDDDQAIGCGANLDRSGVLVQIETDAARLRLEGEALVDEAILRIGFGKAVAAVALDDVVGTIAAPDQIASGSPPQPVQSGIALQRVVLRTAVEVVVAVTTAQPIGAVSSADHVIAGATADGVVTAGAVDDVVASLGDDDVVPGGTRESVVAVGADHGGGHSPAGGSRRHGLPQGDHDGEDQGEDDRTLDVPHGSDEGTGGGGLSTRWSSTSVGNRPMANR